MPTRVFEMHTNKLSGKRDRPVPIILLASVKVNPPPFKRKALAIILTVLVNLNLNVLINELGIILRLSLQVVSVHFCTAPCTSMIETGL